MRVLHLLLLLLSSVTAVFAAWSTSPVSDWDTTELEDWLKDHGLAPKQGSTPSDLLKEVKAHYKLTFSPYSEWDVDTLKLWASQNIDDFDKNAKYNKDKLVKLVKDNWYETESDTEKAYEDSKDWIFDTWSSSTLRNLLSKAGIDYDKHSDQRQLADIARDNFDKLTKSLGGKHYVGKSFYNNWSATEAKRWLQQHHIPIPDRGNRDKLLSLVRNNTRYAYLQTQKHRQAVKEAATQSVDGTLRRLALTKDSVFDEYNKVRDSVFNSWTDKEIQEWLDYHNIPYDTPPQSRSSLIKVAKKNLDKLGDDYTEYTSKFGHKLQSFFDDIFEKVSKGQDAIYDQTNKIKDSAFDKFSDEDLKTWVDYHRYGSHVGASRDELLAIAKKHIDQFNKDFESYTRRLHIKALSGLDSLFTKLDSVGEAVTEQAGNVKDVAYEKWSDEDLQAWLDYHHYADKAAKNRDELLKLASQHADQFQKDYQSYNNRAGQAHTALDNLFEKLLETRDSVVDKSNEVKDSAFDAWSEFDLRQWLHRHNIDTKAAKTRDDLAKLAKDNKDKLLEDLDFYSHSLARGTGKLAQQTYNSIKQDIDDFGNYFFDHAVSLWSDSRLKSFLDARGIPVPQTSNRDELVRIVRRARYKTFNPKSVWSFDTWSTDNLQQYLAKNGVTYEGTRDDLLKKAQEVYATSSNAIGNLKDDAFDKWSEADLKSYLKSYGIIPHEPTTREKLVNAAKYSSDLFKSGEIEIKKKASSADDYFKLLRDEVQSVKSHVLYNLNGFLRRFNGPHIEL